MKTKIQPKLDYSVVRFKSSFQCEYCGKYLPKESEFIQVSTRSNEILKIFRKSSRSGMVIRLCPQCFGKLHSLMEEIEQIGWLVLEED